MTLIEELKKLKVGDKVNWSTGFTLCGGIVVEVDKDRVRIQDTMKLNQPFWVTKDRIRTIRNHRKSSKKKRK